MKGYNPNPDIPDAPRPNKGSLSAATARSALDGGLPEAPLPSLDLLDREVQELAAGVLPLPVSIPDATGDSTASGDPGPGLTAAPASTSPSQETDPQ